MPFRHVPVPDRDCIHPELILPADTSAPTPARLSGICGHTYGYPTCGYGVGILPCPCTAHTGPVDGDGSRHPDRTTKLHTLLADGAAAAERALVLDTDGVDAATTDRLGL